MRKYTGMTSEQILKYNKCLLETMKSVYAYNPDYDKLVIKVGDVSVDDKNVKVLSNLISKNSKIDSDSLNDYIYLGNICFSNYLKYLNSYSVGISDSISITEKDENGNIIVLKSINLTPDFTYCGTDTTSCLLTSLTYNLPAPGDLEEELTFTNSNQIVLKDWEGKNTFMSGSINKQTLYGYDPVLKKLIQLDVSNYTINSEGQLSLKTSSESGNYNFDLVYTSDMIPTAKQTFTRTINVDGNNITLTFTIIIYAEATKVSEDSGSVLYAMYNNNSSYKGFAIRIGTREVRGSDGCSYSIEINSLDISCKGKMLDSTKMTISGSTGSLINLKDQTHEVLQNLISNDSNIGVALKTSVGSYTSNKNSYYWINPNASVHNTYINTNYPMNPRVYFGNATYPSLELYEIGINKITCTVTRRINIASNPNTVVSVQKTNDYSTISEYKYSVYSAYQDAQFRGTSLTINDLYYDSGLSHRLFVRSGLTKPITFSDGASDTYYLRNELFYRGNQASDFNTYSTDFGDYNRLFLYTGPCFTPDRM